MRKGMTMQAPGLTVSPEGVVITPEGMAEIEQRHSIKDALKAQMRAEREAALAFKDSHIGVQLARDLGELELISDSYQGFSVYAHGYMLAGKEAAARTMASIANGLLRGAVELYGKEAEQALTGTSPAEFAVTDPEGLARVARGEVSASELEITLEPMTLADLNELDAKYPGWDDVAAMVRGEYHPETEQEAEAEPVSASEASVSPEPEDTPQRRAAKMRRTAKAMAQQAQTASDEPTLSAETSKS